eukprot:491631-Pyramimonas_sp.AAC.1
MTPTALLQTTAYGDRESSISNQICPFPGPPQAALAWRIIFDGLENLPRKPEMSWGRGRGEKTGQS